MPSDTVDPWQRLTYLSLLMFSYWITYFKYPIRDQAIRFGKRLDPLATPRSKDTEPECIHDGKQLIEQAYINCQVCPPFETVHSSVGYLMWVTPPCRQPLQLLL